MLQAAVRTNPATKKAAFIILTAQGDRALVQKAAALGANNVLAKPFTIEKMKCGNRGRVWGSEMNSDTGFKRLMSSRVSSRSSNDPDVVLSTDLGLLRGRLHARSGRRCRWHESLSAAGLCGRR